MNRSGCACVHPYTLITAKRPNLKLRACPWKLLGYLPSAFWFPCRPLKWCLHRWENITCCRCHQRWRFEKMGEFLLKSHRSAKSLDPNCVFEQMHSLVYYRHITKRKFECFSGVRIFHSSWQEHPLKKCRWVGLRRGDGLLMIRLSLFSLSLSSFLAIFLLKKRFFVGQS